MSFFTKCSNSKRKTHEIAQVQHFEPEKFCYEQTVQIRESLRISLDKTYAELRSLQMMRVVDLACKQQPIHVCIRKCPKVSPLNLGEVSHALYL